MANRILVVDDNSDIRENICEYLNLRGHQTIGASDAASAAYGSRRPQRLAASLFFAKKTAVRGAFRRFF
jgi:hypothetical protein